MHLRLFLLIVAVTLVACADVGDRDNPTDPVAPSYAQSLHYGEYYDPGTKSSVKSKIAWNYMNPAVAYGEVLDGRDVRIYRTAYINDRVWLAENVNYDGSGLCYENDSTLCAKYGRLYTYKEASTVCPQGFHLPTKEEWNLLPDASALLASKGWQLDNGDMGGSNSSGFTVLPGGRYVSVKSSSVDTGYADIAHAAYMWTATKASNDSAYSVLFSSVPERWLGLSPRSDRFYVRCVRESSATFVPVTTVDTTALGG